MTSKINPPQHFLDYVLDKPMKFSDVRRCVGVGFSSEEGFSEELESQIYERIMNDLSKVYDHDILFPPNSEAFRRRGMYHYFIFSDKDYRNKEGSFQMITYTVQHLHEGRYLLIGLTLGKEGAKPEERLEAYAKELEKLKSRDAAFPGSPWLQKEIKSMEESARHLKEEKPLSLTN